MANIGPECRELLECIEYRSASELLEEVPEVENLAKLLSLLASPTRLKILALLARYDKPLPLCIIAAILSKTPQQLAYHLRELRRAGVVREERRGRFAFYRADREKLKTLVASLNRLLQAEA